MTLDPHNILLQHSGMPPSSAFTGKQQRRRFWTPTRASPESICTFLHWSIGSLTFCKVSIDGGRARQRVVERQAQRHRAVAETTEEPLSLQQRKARKLNRVMVEQQYCPLRSPRWSTIDETTREGRTLPAAPSKEIQVTKTCTRRCERKRQGKIVDCFPREATRLLHQPRGPAARLVSHSTGAGCPFDATQHSVCA